LVEVSGSVDEPRPVHPATIESTPIETSAPSEKRLRIIVSRSEPPQENAAWLFRLLPLISENQTSRPAERYCAILPILLTPYSVNQM
jgi:hypothetical protein